MWQNEKEVGDKISIVNFRTIKCEV